MVTNKIILSHLLKALDDMDFFALYPSRRSLQTYLKNAVSDSDKIRAILKDDIVQREIFPDATLSGKEVDDPIKAYRTLVSQRHL